MLIRYFEYMEFDHAKIKDVIPVIMSIEDIDEQLINNSRLPLGFIGKNGIDTILENFISDKTLHFINTYKKLISNLDFQINMDAILNYAINKENIDTRFMVSCYLK